MEGRSKWLEVTQEDIHIDVHYNEMKSAIKQIEFGTVAQPHIA